MKRLREQLMPQGLGALGLAFRQLCERLSAQGLFAAERKRKLPRFPRRIALITSPTGAAVRDMLQVITRRWNAADIVIVPVAVQGDTAAETPVLAKSLLRRIVGVGEDQDKAGHRLECRRRCPADGARPKDNGVFATPDSPPSHEESL